MDAATIRIGFIGAGAICEQRHLPGLAKLEDVTVAAVCNRTAESSRRIADKWHIPDVEADWRALIGRGDIDAVFIGTWPYMHREMSIAALEAGKHVFCQARMCMDLAEARAMHAAAEAHPKQVAMLCPPPHRMPWEPFIQRMINEGHLGAIREVQLVSRSNVNLGEITWRERVEFSGINILQVGIWAETLHACVGEYDSLHAVTATPIPVKQQPDGSDYSIAIPQVVNIHGRLTSGAIITEHHTGVAYHDHTNHVTITGEKATLRVDAMQTIRMGKPGDELKPVDVPPSEQRDWQAEADFIAAVRAANAGQSHPVDPDFATGLKYMRKMQAIHDSNDAGKAIDPQSLE